MTHVRTIAFFLFLSLTSNVLAHTLSGNVLGGSTPLEGAVVYLRDPGTGTNMDTTTTDATGFYSFDVIDGVYNLYVTPPAASGFGDYVVNNIIVSGGDVTQHVVLIENATNYSGVVRTPDGQPAKGVRLKLINEDSGEQVGVDYMTEADGAFSFPLTPGNYFINAWGYGSHANFPIYGRWNASPVVQSFELTGPLTQDIVLPFTRLSGQTVDGSGNPVGNVTLHLYEATYDNLNQRSIYQNMSTEQGRLATSDANGNFDIYVLNFLEAQLNLYPPTGLGVANTQHTLDLSADLHTNLVLDDGFTYSGVVRLPDGSPAEGVELTMRHVSDGSDATPVFETDATGTFAFELPPGEYYVYSRAYGTPASQPGYWAMNQLVPPFTLSANLEQDIHLPITKLTGYIRDEQGNPVEGVHLQTLHSFNFGDSYHYVNSRNYGPLYYSDATGYYELVVLSGTGYNVVAEVPEDSHLGTTYQADVDITVDSTLDFVLPPAATMTGRVLNPKGEPVHYAYIAVTTPDNAIYVGLDYVTDETGYYRLPLAPGDYNIRVWGYRGANNDHVPGYYRVQPILAAYPLLEPEERDLVLPLKYITGQTTDSNGVPVPGVTTSSYENRTDQTGQNLTADNRRYLYVVSDANGDYSHPTFSFPELSMVVLPPEGSGFAQTVVPGFEVLDDFNLNIILGFQDQLPPLILSGPYVNNITDTTAVVSWTTSEAASSDLYYGTSSPTSLESVAGFRTNHSVLLTGLNPNTQYYVKGSSTDPAGNGPAESSTVGFRTLPEPDTEPPLILEGPWVEAISHNSATVRWVTSEPADSRVNYGTTESLGSIESDGTDVVEHSIELFNLNANTQYFYEVSSRDANGNGPTVSATLSFHTLDTPDTEAPLIIAGPMVVDITDTEATVIWETNEAATSGVSYNDGTAYGVYSDETLTTTHSVRLTGLTPDTVYNYTVSSRDAANNGPTLSDEEVFQTLPAPDTAPPLILEGPIVLGITHQSGVIRWKTDEPSDSVIYYGTSAGALDYSVSRAALVTNHNLPLVGLEAATEIFFQVCSTDAGGNGPQCSSIYSFTTKGLPDTTPPVFTLEPIILETTNTSVTLYWETDESADGYVNYGIGSNLNKRKGKGKKTTRHQVMLSGLQPNTSYNYEVTSTDLSGNVATFTGSVSKRSAGFQTDLNADTTAPSITSQPQVVSVTPETALISWATDEIADSRVYYGELGDPLALFAGDIEYTSDHLVQLTGLTPNTTYSFQASSRDSSGNGPTLASTVQFTTPDTGGTPAPSIIAGPDVTPEDTKALVTWETDTFTTSQVDYGTVSGELTNRVATTGLETDHALTLTNLEEGTVYYYVVTSVDNQGRTVTSNETSFTSAGDPPEITIDDLSITEGDSGSASYDFTLTLSKAYGSATTVDYTTSDGTATAGDDFAGVSGTLTIAAGDTSATISVSVYGDTDEEDQEWFSLDLSNPSNAVLTDSQGVATIDDNDEVCVSINTQPSGADLCEGNNITLSIGASGSALPSNATEYQWYLDGVMIDGATAADLVLNGVTSADSGDYTCTVSNNCNSLTSATATLAITPELSDPSAINGSNNVCEGDAVTFSIDALDSSASYVWSYPADATLDSDNGNSITLTFGASGGDVEVYATNDCTTTATSSLSVSLTEAPDTASAGADAHIQNGGSITLSANSPAVGSGSWSFVSGPDTSSAQLSSTTDPNATFSPSSIGTYVLRWTVANGCGSSSDDLTISVSDLPGIDITDQVVTEGDSGSVTASFSVTLSSAAPVTVTVDYATSADSATAGVDFGAVSGSLSFASGETSKTVTVDVYGDTTEEDQERFYVSLSNPSNANLGDALGEGFITDDDQVCIAITGHPSGASTCAGGDITLSVTASGSQLASNATTYQWHKGGVAISGATSATYTITNSTSDDAGSYTCTVANNCNSLTSNAAVVAIDSAPASPGSISGSSDVCEGATVTYSISDLGSGTQYFWSIPNGVTLDIDNGNSITVTFGANGGNVSVYASNDCGTTTTSSLGVSLTETPNTAVAGNGGNIQNGGSMALSANTPSVGTGTWSFVSGPNTATSQLSSTTDPAATFSPSAVGTYVLRWTVANGCGSSTDDVTISVSEVPVLSINDQTVTEGDSGTVNASFTVTLSASAPVTVTVDYATSADTATAGSDFTATNGTLTFASGETSKTVTVLVSGDTAEEDQERFYLTLTNPSNGTLGDAIGDGIINDDDQVCVAITDQPEGASTCAGGDITLSVTASGSELASNATTYQWHKDGTVISGATSATYTITDATIDAAGSYTCTVANNCNSLTTDAAVIALDNALGTLSAISGDSDLCAGSTVTYSVTDLGNNADYTWTIPSGATLVSDDDNSITVTLGTASGNVSVYAENLCGITDTETLSITINEAPDQAQAGDDQTVLQDVQITLAANSPSKGNGVWTVTSGPSSLASQFSDASDPAASFTPAGGPGSYELTWTIASGACDDSSDTVSVVVQTTADASLALSVDNDRPNVGDIVEATFILANAGPSDLDNPTVTINLPAGVDLNSHTGGANFDGSQWQPASVATDAEETLVLQLEITDAGAMTLSGEIAAMNEVDPDSTAGNSSLNEDDHVEQAIVPQKADVALDASLSTSEPSVGQVIVLSLTATNHGPDVATSLSIQAQIPADLELVNTPAGYDPLTSVWSLGDLAVSAPQNLELHLQLVTLANGEISVEVQATDVYDPDSVPANDELTEDDRASFSIVPQDYLSFSADLEAELVSRPEVDTYDDDAISPLEASALTELDLSGTGITDYSGIQNLAHLQELRLNDNQLMELPNLGDLSQLQRLDISDNQLTEWIGSLPQSLHTLAADRNPMMQLPAAVTGLTNLQELYLSENHLQTLPPNLDQLTNLRVLDISQNSLHTLPTEIGQLPALEVLHLNDNELSTLPALNTPNLAELNAAHNQLNTLPNLDALNLTYLDLRHNRLEDIEELSTHPALANAANHVVLLEHNWLASNEACAQVETLRLRAATSGALIEAEEQGNLAAEGEILPTWNGVGQSPLLQWVQELQTGTYTWTICP